VIAVANLLGMNRARLPLLLLASAFAVGCEGRGANIVGPAGRGSLSRFVAIGTGLSMGAQSGGVLYNSQVEAWPALLSRQANVDFAMPQLRSPGCAPPLIAPLQFWRLLSGVDAALGDSSCAGALSGLTPPTNNLALAGATAWAALNLTPKAVVAAPLVYGAGDRSRYPLVLGLAQSQVTAMLVLRPTFVSVELGLTELLGASQAGLLVPAAAYGQVAPWTYVPQAVFAPVFKQVVDSVKLSGAKAVLLGVPRMSNLASMRAGTELWADRAALLTYGVVVAADCEASANLVATAAVVPALTARSRATGTPQPLSCADVPGTVDHVLTPADAAVLDQLADQISAQARQLAEQNGWAFVDLNGVFASIMAQRAPYSADAQLDCASPYGQYLSLDGVSLNVAGHQLVANAVAGAISARYGFTIPALAVPVVPTAQLCR
jgi:hypothetical protein